MILILDEQARVSRNNIERNLFFKACICGVIQSTCVFQEVFKETFSICNSVLQTSETTTGQWTLLMSATPRAHCLSLSAKAAHLDTWTGRALTLLTTGEEVSPPITASPRSQMTADPAVSFDKTRPLLRSRPEITSSCKAVTSHSRDTGYALESVNCHTRA